VSGFRKFLLRGNVVDLAVAVVIGAAFGAVITAFTKAFITPLIGVAAGATGNISAKTFRVSGVTFPYGLLVDALISFVIIAAIVYFLVVLPINHLMERYKPTPEEPTPVKECPDCLSSIPAAAHKCAFCTSPQTA